MPCSPGWSSLDVVASAQRGLVSVAQLRGLGFTKRSIAIASRAGRLVAVRRSVYRLAGVVMGWESEVMAAVLAAGEGAAASHMSAARLWRLLDDGDQGRERGSAERIELTSPSRVRLAGATVYFQTLARAERTVRFSVPVTSPGRTLLDLGVRLGHAELGELTDEALRRGLVPLERLRRLALSSGDGRARRGGRALARVLEDRLPGYDAGANGWERRMDRLWDAWGLPPAQRQFEIHTPGGVYRPDRAIVALRIAVDWNGYDYHGRRSHFDADSDRRADLAAAGWYPLDFTSRSSPERICTTVRSVVAQRSATVPTPISIAGPTTVPTPISIAGPTPSRPVGAPRPVRPARPLSSVPRAVGDRR